MPAKHLERDMGRGTLQGALISSLLSNINMRRFLLSWKKLGCAEELDARIVNYADDFVICCREKASEASSRMRILTRGVMRIPASEKNNCWPKGRHRRPGRRPAVVRNPETGG